MATNGIDTISIRCLIGQRITPLFEQVCLLGVRFE